MAQRRKLRVLAALIVAATLVVGAPAVASAGPPLGVEWREFSSLEEFEAACSAMGGTPERRIEWSYANSIRCRTLWFIWEVHPMGWRGPAAQRALWARYGPNDWAPNGGCPGCGGGGSW